MMSIQEWLKRATALLTRPEVLQAIGQVKAYGKMTWQILARPEVFFSGPEFKGDYQQGLFFSLVICAFTAGLSFLLHRVSGPVSITDPVSIPLFLTYLAAAFLFILMCLLTWLFASSGFAHLLVVKLFKGKGIFDSTFNVFAYASANIIFVIFSLPGILFSAVWYSLVVITGLKAQYKLETKKAVWAYLLSLPVWIILLGTIFSLTDPYNLGYNMADNRLASQLKVMTISQTIEKYKNANKSYPTSEEALKYEHISLKPYKTYQNRVVDGYTYNLALQGNGYEIVARPYVCGSTGNKTFKVITGGIFSEEGCTR